MGTSLFLFASEAGEIHPIIVSFIGVAVVFIGLACIIGLVELLSLVCNKILKGDKKQSASEKKAEPQAVASAVIENRGEIVAAVCAAIAEEEGTDISAIRVISFKKL